MKKRIVLFLVLVFALCCVTGCGGGSEGSSSGNVKEVAGEDYVKLYSDANAFKGYKVDMFLKVFAVEKDDSGTYLQAYYDPEGLDKNTIVTIDDPGVDVKDGDIIHVTGTVKGEFTGENMLGAKITAPQITASSIEKSDYATAFAPAINTAEANQEQNQHGILLILEKVEFAEKETRAYLTVKNGTKDNASFYSFNAKAVQGSQQFEADDNWDANYQEVQSDILPGIESSGIVVFPAIDPAAGAIQLIFECRSDDFFVDFNPFSFTVQ